MNPIEAAKRIIQAHDGYDGPATRIDEQLPLLVARTLLALLPGEDVRQAAKRLKMMHDGHGIAAYGRGSCEHKIRKDEAAVICHCVPFLLSAIEGETP